MSVTTMGTEQGWTVATKVAGSLSFHSSLLQRWSVISITLLRDMEGGEHGGVLCIIVKNADLNPEFSIKLSRFYTCQWKRNPLPRGHHRGSGRLAYRHYMNPATDYFEWGSFGYRRQSLFFRLPPDGVRGRRVAFGMTGLCV